MSKNELPSYTNFVFGFSLWLAIGAALGFTGTTGIFATLIVTYWTGDPATIDELITAGAGYVMATFWALSFVVMIFVQNEKWIDLVRKPAQPRQTPSRPMFQSVGEMRNHARIRVAKQPYMPLDGEHAKQIYHNLKRRKWLINRTSLEVEYAGEPAYPNIAKNYGPILTEWNRLGWIDGWVRGNTKKEKHHLNAAGQAGLTDYAGISLPHSD